MGFQPGNKFGHLKKGTEVTKALAYLMLQPYVSDRIGYPAKPTNAQKFAAKMLTRAFQGDMEASKIVWDRYEGKVAQPISGDENGPPVRVEDITLKEVARRISSLLYEAELEELEEANTIDHEPAQELLPAPKASLKDLMG